uniref:Uncharacterized protein n=1 Tax=Anguilla anguilla TaxID=7936 RepID=A0A0E9Q9C5_ANGAN
MCAQSNSFHPIHNGCPSCPMPPSTESTQTTPPSLLSSKTGTPFPPNSSASPTLCHGVKITSSISMLPKQRNAYQPTNTPHHNHNTWRDS